MNPPGPPGPPPIPEGRKVMTSSHFLSEQLGQLLAKDKIGLTTWCLGSSSTTKLLSPYHSNSMASPDMKRGVQKEKRGKRNEEVFTSWFSWDATPPKLLSGCQASSPGDRKFRTIVLLFGMFSPCAGSDRPCPLHPPGI